MPNSYAHANVSACCHVYARVWHACRCVCGTLACRMHYAIVLMESVLLINRSGLEFWASTSDGYARQGQREKEEASSTIKVCRITKGTKKGWSQTVKESTTRSSEEAKWSKSQGAQKKQQNSQGVKMSRSQGVQKKPNGPRSAPAPEKKVVLYARQSSGSTWTHGRKRQFDAGAAAIKSYMAENNVKKFKTRRVGEIKNGSLPLDKRDTLMSLLLDPDVDVDPVL